MSNVILLADTVHQRKAKPHGEGTSAEIVIFHGVRVERLTDDMIQSSMVRNPRRLPSIHNQATAEELE